MKHASIWFDGASKGNPGPMAGGAVVECDGSPRVVLHGHASRGTNNQAEYEGLLLGLHHALDCGATAVTVYGDSQLVIRQLEGRYQVKAPTLQGLYRDAKRLLDRFERVELNWIPRAQNADADQAANEALAL